MAEYNHNKYYWLKLKDDFFKRHEIKIIKAMPNGKEYVLFYLNLLLESISHEGHLRFSDTIPYNEEMLAALTDTNIDVVRSAMKIFEELNLIEILDDATIYLRETQRMIGESTEGAERKRIQREERKEKLLSLGTNSGQEADKRPPEIRDKEIRDKDIKEKKKEKKSERFTPPSVGEVRKYCEDRHNNIDAQAFVDFYASKGWKVGNQPMKNWEAAVRTWEQRHKNDKPTQARSSGFDLDNFFEAATRR